MITISDLSKFIKDADCIQLKETTDYYIEGMTQMIEIEKNFNIKFDMEDIDNKMECFDLYDAVEIICNGIFGECNCKIPFSRFKFKEIFPELEIEEPFFLDIDLIPLPAITIGEYSFIPNRAMVLPDNYKEETKCEEDFLLINASCSFILESLNHS